MTASDKRYTIQHGTQVDNPDLDWSQIRETVTMLALAVAQVESSMTDGDQSVGQLTDSFTHIADYTSKILGMAKDTKTSMDDDFRVALLADATALNEKVHKAVVAFQFYDRITQRLDHVCKTLDRLGRLIGDKSMLYNPECWRGLQQDIKSSYTMEAERIMFEHILQGHSIDEALAIYNHHFNAEEKGLDKATGDDIELF